MTRADPWLNCLSGLLIASWSGALAAWCRGYPGLTGACVVSALLCVTGCVVYSAFGLYVPGIPENGGADAPDPADTGHRPCLTGTVPRINRIHCIHRRRNGSYEQDGDHTMRRLFAGAPRRQGDDLPAVWHTTEADDATGDGPGTAVSCVAQGVCITGDIVAGGQLHISGEVRGGITSLTGAVTVMPGGVVDGDITCLQLDVHGSVRGRCEAREVLVGETGSISGGLIYHALSVHPGALLCGDIRQCPALSPQAVSAVALKEATGDAGDVTGYGDDADGHVRAFRVQAGRVPE